LTEERVYRENAEFLARISGQQEEEEVELVEVEEEVEGGVGWVRGRGMTGVARWPVIRFACVCVCVCVVCMRLTVGVCLLVYAERDL